MTKDGPDYEDVDWPQEEEIQPGASLQIPLHIPVPPDNYEEEEEIDDDRVVILEI